MITPNSIIRAFAIGMTTCQCLASEVKQERYGRMPDGREANIYTLINKNGLKARVTEYGAILVSMEVPDKHGKSADITHGYDTLDGWLTNTSYFGSTVGRFGNRIKDGKFTLDGKPHCGWLPGSNTPGRAESWKFPPISQPSSSTEATSLMAP
jgi:aldose 1-epimerase